MTDGLPEELREAGRWLEIPAPSPDSVAEQVLARLLAEAAPAPAVPAPGRRSRARAWAAARWRALTAVLCGLLVVLVLTPPVRAAVADWFGFGGVVVHRDPCARPGTGAPPPVRGDAPLDGAYVPQALGEPDGVAAVDGGRVLSMSWRVDGRTVRLDQFRATIDMVFLKKVGGAAEWVELGTGTDYGVWFAEPHYVQLVDPDGRTRREAPRTAGPTLVWQRGGTTLRLEGVPDLARALAVADSARRRQGLSPPADGNLAGPVGVTGAGPSERGTGCGSIGSSPGPESP
ncbi:MULTISPECIES: hypothetical protein [unclassified Streptomyces]|uniref:hypothetical protein n=1 Tax=unclassified Streptomyces TaxID=2593676 RepID=UPI00035F76FE|nr:MULTISPECIES: hypothetical protein [unclassified Streptomyces]MYX35252.1 hypothetical protein [Streptomyces sp. SID8377]